MAVFPSCLVISLLFSWMITYVNVWISYLHSVETRTGSIPSLDGALVQAHDHAAPHKYGRENVNYDLMLWDRIMKRTKLKITTTQVFLAKV